MRELRAQMSPAYSDYQIAQTGRDAAGTVLVSSRDPPFCKVTGGLTGMEKNEFLQKLSRYLFWDCDIDMLDPDIDRKLILERVFSMGTENDIKEVVRYYDIAAIKNEIITIKILDNKTLNYLSLLFKIPKRRFLCCKKNAYQNLY